MRIIPNTSIMYAFHQIHNKLLSIQPSPVTMRNELTELKPICSETASKEKKIIQFPEQVFISQGERKEQIAIDDRVYESLSEPLTFENIRTLEASDCLNDRITVTVTVGDTEHPARPEHPGRPPHHPDKPHHPPHKEQDCGNSGTTVTLTFVKSLGLSSIYTSENSLTINNEKILLNTQGGALLVMPDDTLRWGKLKPEILEQIRQQNKQDDFPEESGEENGNED